MLVDLEKPHLRQDHDEEPDALEQEKDNEIFDMAAKFRNHVERLDDLVQGLKLNVNNADYVQSRCGLITLRLSSMVKDGRSWIPRLEAASFRVSDVLASARGSDEEASAKIEQLTSQLDRFGLDHELDMTYVQEDLASTQRLCEQRQGQIRQLKEEVTAIKRERDAALEGRRQAEAQVNHLQGTAQHLPSSSDMGKTISAMRAEIDTLKDESNRLKSVGSTPTLHQSHTSSTSQTSVQYQSSFNSTATEQSTPPAMQNRRQNDNVTASGPHTTHAGSATDSNDANALTGFENSQSALPGTQLRQDLQTWQRPAKRPRSSNSSPLRPSPHRPEARPHSGGQVRKHGATRGQKHRGAEVGKRSGHRNTAPGSMAPPPPPNASQPIDLTDKVSDSSSSYNSEDESLNTKPPLGRQMTPPSTVIANSIEPSYQQSGALLPQSLRNRPATQPQRPPKPQWASARQSEASVKSTNPSKPEKKPAKPAKPAKLSNSGPLEGPRQPTGGYGHGFGGLTNRAYGSAHGAQPRPNVIPPSMPGPGFHRSNANGSYYPSDAFSQSGRIGLTKYSPQEPVPEPQSQPKHRAGPETSQTFAQTEDSDDGRSDITVSKRPTPSRKIKEENSTFDMRVVLSCLDIWHPDRKGNRMPASDAPHQLLAAFEPHWRTLFNSPTRTETLRQNSRDKSFCIRRKACHKPAAVDSEPSSCANCVAAGEVCMKQSPTDRPLIVPLPANIRGNEPWHSPRFWVSSE